MWDMALDRSTLTMYVENTSLIQHQKIVPIVGWEVAAIMIEQLAFLLLVNLGPSAEHHTVCKIIHLIDAADKESAPLRAQANYQTDMPSALV